eukprot:COSAG06_NODE_306_length_17801_cov_6.989210_14_plen_34_part_01
MSAESEAGIDERSSRKSRDHIGFREPDTLFDFAK